MYGLLEYIKKRGLMFDMARSIMVQGTMSNAGKSLLAAGLCRVFVQDGYRVAPFKSQNMALNSYITKDGLEMGRAQVMQAEACGIEPEVYMNPILLKPTNDIGSQVIVNGEVQGNMKAMQYYKEKRKYIPKIMEAYETLSSKNDIIVIEGAGSPAENNLKENDIVNMGMAKMAKAPVLLAGDIDRGGVFAQLIGTLMLLDDDEKDIVKGLVINKFRGDKDILMPGIKMLEERVGKQVLGVVPYLNVDIDDEDSLSERFKKKSSTGLIDIVIIRLPRISNFTDFNVFECFNDVNVRYVTSPQQFGNPDMVIIPGTKNTIEDLMWLRQNGLEAKIIKASSMNKVIFGICGGFQMLGNVIDDPIGVEHKGSIRGMGLISVSTVFKDSKTRTRVNGHFKNVQGVLQALNGLSIEGYEIHMGETTNNTSSMCELTFYENTQSEKASIKEDGAQHENVYGSYVHGIFDAPDVAKSIVMSLFREKGLDYKQIKAFNIEEYKQKQYDILADAIRSSMDMNKIYEIIDKGI